MPFGLAPLAPGFPPLPRSPSLHAVLTTPVDRIGAYRFGSGALRHRVLPDSLWPSRRTQPVGIHSFMFRGLLKLHSRYGLQFCSPTSSGLCHEAPAPTVIPSEPLVSYPGIPIPPGVGLSPTGDLRHRGARARHESGWVAEVLENTGSPERTTYSPAQYGVLRNQKYQTNPFWLGNLK